MDNKIFIINGPAESGKDTFVEFCTDFAVKHKLKVHNISSVDPVKQAAKILGMTKKDEAGRQLLADIKQAWVRYNDGPLKYLVEEINSAEESIVFLHIREPEEIKKIRKIYPHTQTVFVDRKNAIAYRNGADDSTSEIEYDITIDNNSNLEELKLHAQKFIQKLI